MAKKANTHDPDHAPESVPASELREAPPELGLVGELGAFVIELYTVVREVYSVFEIGRASCRERVSSKV